MGTGVAVGTGTVAIGTAVGSAGATLGVEQPTNQTSAIVAVTQRNVGDPW